MKPFYQNCQNVQTSMVGQYFVPILPILAMIDIAIATINYIGQYRFASRVDWDLLGKSFKKCIKNGNVNKSVFLL